MNDLKDNNNKAQSREDESLLNRVDHNTLKDSLSKGSRKGKAASEKSTRKGKGSAEKHTSQMQNATGGKTSSDEQSQDGASILAPNTKQAQKSLSEDVDEIKRQLKSITGSLASMTPVITEIKTAYDNYNQFVDEMSSDNESHTSGDGKDLEDGEIQDPPSEPPKKKPRKELGVLAGMAKVVNKPQQDGEDLDQDLSELLTELLSKGASKDSREELIEKIPTPGNCQRLEVVRVNPEIFNSVRKEVKTEDVMLQKAQKPLLKGITAVANVLTEFITAYKDKETASEVTTNAMQTLSDSLSLLCDASHEIDLRRRALFKSDMKAEYRLLCSDQNPVKDLLFGTELGKSVKDLTEASRVTAKVSSKYKRPSSNAQNHQTRHEQRRIFPFLGRGRGFNGRQKSGYRNVSQKNQSQYQPRK